MGLSAVKLAEILGVSKVTVSRWETGQERIGSSADRAIRLLYLVSQANDLDPIIGNPRPIGKRQRAERITISWCQSKRKATAA
jgi:transcriptional regulator with XRE-family HTH domain